MNRNESWTIDANTTFSSRKKLSMMEEWMGPRYFEGLDRMRYVRSAAD
jgi:hypothetical protein